MQELEKILEEIDREIEERRKDPETRDVDICYGLNRAKEIIRRHMNDGWIPVEERLPEGGEEVLVQGEFYSRRNNMTYTHIHIMRLNKMTGEWNGVYGVPNGKVIAWQPLPEP